MTILLFSEAIETPEKRNMAIFTIFSAVSLMLFSMAWTGWSYLFYIMFFTGLIYILLCKLRKIKFKKFLEVFLLFIGLSLILIGITSGIEGFLSLINYPLSFFTFLPGHDSIGSWPNIYESVGELQKPNFDSFISGAGPVNLGLGIFGIFVIASIMLRRDMRTKYLPELSWYVFILIFVWITLALIAYSSGIRFGLLVIAPLAVFSGILVGVAINYLDNFSLLKSKKKLILSIFLVMIICLPPIANIDQTVSFFFPGADDNMMNSALWIKDNTNQDTQIISDWSYGHFFTAFSNRGVVFDGGSQNTPRTYWIYKAFSTDNESLSEGIFRMLSSSGDESFTTLENYTKNTSLTVEILNNILGIPKDDARNVLRVKYKIDPIMSEKLLNYTHPVKTNPFVVFTSNDMIYGGQWTFVYGDWNFKKAKKSNYTYSGGTTNSTGEIRNYSNGVLLNLKNKKATWNGKSIYSAIIVENDTNYSFLMDNKSNFYAIFLMNEKRVIIIDKKYQNSLFVKMVFLKQPTKLFKPIYKNKSTMIWTTKS
ncbi:MAG: STT3 domain-containing protein [Methanobacteriaceae archaeon]|nr:STT3 domain-containing protein [Methanobacteriaceae archaeon]